MDSARKCDHVERVDIVISSKDDIVEVLVPVGFSFIEYGSVVDEVAVLVGRPVRQGAIADSQLGEQVELL